MRKSNNKTPVLGVKFYEESVGEKPIKERSLPWACR